MSFAVALVGRPNVGKSTLFNRLVGRRLALVDKQAGVTRDRREGRGRLGGLEFQVIDTAGLEEAEPESLTARMQDQTRAVLAEADVALFLIDARVGVTPADQHFARVLHKAGTPVVLIANKCEGGRGEAGYLDAFSLGLGEPVTISAEHGEGLNALYESLIAVAPAEPEDLPSRLADEGEGETLQLAIVGRPNVGKSTLVNHLLGEERVVTGPEAGITRDAIAVRWEIEGRPVELVDTAGLRRKAKVVDRLEELATADSVRAIRLAHVVALMIDGTAPLEKQDLAIAKLAADEGRALVIVINKWDLVSDQAAALKRLGDRLERSLPQLRGLAVLPLSALTGERVDALVPAVLAAYDVWNRRIATARLNRWLSAAVARHPPPRAGRNRIQLRYVTQAKARPPTFILFASRTEGLPDSYLRYLVNELRDTFALPGAPLRLLPRKAKNPYTGRGRVRPAGRRRAASKRA